MTDFKIRPVLGDDIPFIYSTFLRSYRNDSAIGLSVKKSVFYSEYQTILDHTITQETTITLIACSPEDHSVIFGYIIADPTNNYLHYCYTKDAFRKLGIAKALYSQIFSAGAVSPTITHKTHSVKELSQRFNYNPFVLYRKINQKIRFDLWMLYPGLAKKSDEISEARTQNYIKKGNNNV